MSQPAEIAASPMTSSSSRSSSGGEHELFGEEGIAVGRGLGELGEAFGVHDAEREVELPEHLHEPLVQERLGHDDQHAGVLSANEARVHDQTRLDRLAEAHLVGEQEARVLALERADRDVDLVGEHRHAGAGEAAHARVRQAPAVLEHRASQGAYQRAPSIRPANRRSRGVPNCSRSSTSVSTSCVISPVSFLVPT